MHLWVKLLSFNGFQQVNNNSLACSSVRFELETHRLKEVNPEIRMFNEEKNMGAVEKQYQYFLNLSKVDNK